MLKQVISLLLLGALWTSSLHAEEEKPFRVPKSTLDASERVLDQERDPFKRLQLLLRWIKIKEEYEQTRIFERGAGETDELEKSKKEIISRLEKEVPSLSAVEGLNIEDLYRELGFRHLEIRDFDKASKYFLLITNKTSNDFLALGDAFVQLDEIPRALNFYAEASKDPKLANTAAYKRAWAYMQLNDFESALKEFDRSLRPSEFANAKLREEAYQDRIRPYLETFTKSTFDETEAKSFQKIATSIHPEDKEKQKTLYVDALKLLIEGFTSKSEIEKAQNAFFFLSREIEDTTAILILSAPTWIKVYRGRLEHEAVERILVALPSAPLEIKDSGTLRGELYNTAVFYETLVHDENREEHKDLLLLTYKKYFELYPKDPDADSLRVNYSRLLLQEGDAGTCLDILKDRNGKEASVEELASSLEGKCELKHLDQLYVEAHTEFFYTKLNRALIESKIYLRPDLGVSPEQAFESLSRMLIGSLQKNPNTPIARLGLRSLIKDYPYSKEKALFTELRTVSAELSFQDLLADKRPDREKAGEFFEIYKASPGGTQVAEKSLTNSIIMEREQVGLERCDVFQNIYPSQFLPEKAVFDYCVELAEHFLQIEKEYSYWLPLQKNLNESQSIRLGLLELALEKSGGRKRIEKINSDQARSVLENWEGAWPKDIPLDPKWNETQKRVRAYLSQLKPVKFDQIGAAVPKQISGFDRADAVIVQYYETQPHALYQARSLELRSELATSFANWMSKLPEPPGLSEEELLLYREKSQEVVQPWLDRAGTRKKECGELAHSLSVEFKGASEDFCPEQAPESIYRDFLVEWRSSIQRRGRIQRIVQIILSRAQQSAKDDPLKARYYLFRALDLSKNERERARVFLALAQLTGKERFWRLSAAQDGALLEPIQWFKDQSEGNPFFTKLYDRQLRILRRWNEGQL